MARPSMSRVRFSGGNRKGLCWRCGAGSVFRSLCEEIIGQTQSVIDSVSSRLPLCRQGIADLRYLASLRDKLREASLFKRQWTHEEDSSFHSE